MSSYDLEGVVTPKKKSGAEVFFFIVSQPPDAPTITAVSEGRSFMVGEPAVLACHIQARPLEAAHVRWARDGYDLASRTMASFENGTALLQIARVERSDIGNFTCIVDNQRGAPAAQNVLLVVQSKLLRNSLSFRIYISL